jgi:hypothetical protein
MPTDRAGRPADPLRLAPLPRRAAAWLIDVALGAALAAGFVDATGGAADLDALWHLVAFKSVTGPAGRQLQSLLHPGTVPPSASLGLLRLLAVLSVVAAAGVAYRVVTTALWGAGLGKWVLGLRIVVDPAPGDASDLDAPGWARAWRRWLVPQGPGLLPLPGTGLLAFAPAVTDRRRRGLHDRAAGTVVVALPSGGAQQLGGLRQERSVEHAAPYRSAHDPAGQLRPVGDHGRDGLLHPVPAVAGVDLSVYVVEGQRAGGGVEAPKALYDQPAAWAGLELDHAEGTDHLRLQPAVRREQAAEGEPLE